MEPEDKLDPEWDKAGIQAVAEDSPVEADSQAEADNQVSPRVGNLVDRSQLLLGTPAGVELDSHQLGRMDKAQNLPSKTVEKRCTV